MFIAETKEEKRPESLVQASCGNSLPKPRVNIDGEIDCWELGNLENYLPWMCSR
jgi:hypothetical protein